MKRVGYIYKYTFPNGKVYIGQTRTSVEQRHYVHMSDARKKGRGCLCDVALAKYGEIKPETIETIEVEEHECTKLIDLLNEAETKWIEFYNSTDKSKGYNIQQGGKIVTPEEMILEEKWYEIFNKEKWGELLGFLQYNLKNIDKKLLTHEKLNKDEKYTWFGYKFNSDLIEGETSFSRYYNTFKHMHSDEEAFEEVILEHAWPDLIQDVQQTIWKQVMKKKDDIIKEYWNTAKIKRV